MNPEAVARYAAHLTSHDPANRVAMDLAHVQFICGCIFAHKPAQLLELGIGTGFLSRAMLRACECNERGQLTCVDNAHDWQGVAPTHFTELAAAGANVVLSDEQRFLKATTSRFDLIVCDGDHEHTDVHARRISELANDGAFLFFHDTANPDFPNLRRIKQAAKYSGYNHHEFTTASLPTERTQRGLLLVINERSRSWRLPPSVRLREIAARVRRKACRV